MHRLLETLPPCATIAVHPDDAAVLVHLRAWNDVYRRHLYLRTDDVVEPGTMMLMIDGDVDTVLLSDAE